MSKPRKRKRVAKGPNNNFLPPQYQGRRFKVTMVKVTPRITIIGDDGVEENEFYHLEIAWHKSAWGKPLVEHLKSLGLEVG